MRFHLFISGIAILLCLAALFISVAPTIAQEQERLISVTITPAEGGIVTAAPGINGGLACGEDETRCAERYRDKVLLRATAQPGWRMRYWVVNDRRVETEKPLLLSGEGPYTVEAVFSKTSLTIVSTPPPMRGNWYEYSIELLGGWGMKQCSLVKKPDGMKIYAGEYSDCDIEWSATPQDIGTHEVVVQADDSDGLTAEQTFTITVSAANFDEIDPVVSVSVAPNSATFGESVVIASTADDNIGVLAFELIIEGTKISETPGKVTYTPPAPGEYEIVVVAQDGGGNTNMARVWLRVNAPEQKETQEHE